LIMLTWHPRDCIRIATFSGAPPMFLWSGKQSHNTSPQDITLSFFPLFTFMVFRQVCRYKLRKIKYGKSEFDLPVLIVIPKLNIFSKCINRDDIKLIIK